MLVLTSPNWTDYQLIDSGEGQRLERFGQYVLVRPDPQIIWKKSLPQDKWKKADAIFTKTSGDKGKWEVKAQIPEKWILNYNNLKFYCKLSPFKHTGVFPEQAAHWEYIDKTIKKQLTTGRQTISILNLFGYTGLASLTAAQAGAKVTHVDASFPTIGWARENQKLSGLEDKPIRWILDDALKFVQREVKRGVKYDGIIMDPPIYGHGPKGEKWDFNRSFPALLDACRTVLSSDPMFVIVNAYAISSSALMLQNVLSDFLKELNGEIESGELALQENIEKRLLSTGIFARWTKKS